MMIVCGYICFQESLHLDDLGFIQHTKSIIVQVGSIMDCCFTRGTTCSD